VSTEEFTDGHIAGHIIIDSALRLTLANTRTPPFVAKSPARRRTHTAGRGAYAMRALPDLRFRIVSGRLGHLDPWILFMVSTP
jgi:hypothetical protein